MSSKVEKSLRIALAAFLVLGVGAMPAFATDTNADGQSAAVAGQEAPMDLRPLIAIGAGIITVGGGLGIGSLARGAMEGTARQPEAGGQIRTSMIIAAALIEGFTFFALVVCLII